MKIDDLRALVEQRRSTRGYDENREVSNEAVAAILDCARWAPSGGNGQPWEFIVPSTTAGACFERALGRVRR